MEEIRTKVETYYDFEGDDVGRQAEVTFDQGGSRWRRASSGYCFRDGRRVSREEFDRARGAHLEEVGRRLSAMAGEARESADGVIGRAAARAQERAAERAAGREDTVEKKTEMKPRRRRSRDVAFEHEGTGVTLTARQCEFLRAAGACPCWTGGDGTLWTDVLLDELGMGGMSFGAMVSTLREKGLLRVWTESREDGATGRSRKVKAVRLTDLGERVVRAAGYRLPGA